MRCLALVVLGACSFTPGALSTGDAKRDDARIDTLVPGDDALVDGPPDSPPPSPIKVRSIDVVDAEVTGGPHTDFPLLVSLTTTWLRSTATGGDVASATGTDLYFSSDQAGQTRLAHDVELYQPDTGVFIAWVKVPSLTAQTVIYLHYGDVAITTSQENVTGTWSNAYELVAHLDGSGDATNKAASLPGINLGAGAAKIGIGRTYNGSDSYTIAGSLTPVDDIFTAGGTIEGWFNATTYGEGSRGRILDKAQWGLFVDNFYNTNSLVFFHNCTGGNGVAQWHFGTNSTSVNAWHHVALVYDKDDAANVPTVYIDGMAVAASEDDPPSTAMVSDDANDLYLGNEVGQQRTFDGTLDELRMSSVTRTDGWVKTQYSNQNAPGSFYTVSAPL